MLKALKIADMFFYISQFVEYKDIYNLGITCSVLRNTYLQCGFKQKHIEIVKNRRDIADINNPKGMIINHDCHKIIPIFIRNVNKFKSDKSHAVAYDSITSYSEMTVAFILMKFLQIRSSALIDGTYYGETEELAQGIISSCFCQKRRFMNGYKNHIYNIKDYYEIIFESGTTINDLTELELSILCSMILLAAEIDINTWTFNDRIYLIYIMKEIKKYSKYTTTDRVISRIPSCLFYPFMNSSVYVKNDGTMDLDYIFYVL
jgi:hypothetical protein